MNQSLTNRQISLIIFNTIVGYGVVGLPKNVAENAGTAGWIPLLIATAISIIVTYIITYLGYVHENKTLYEYSQILTGKFITYIFVTFYIIYFFLFLSMVTRASSEVIKLTVLIKTPIWVLSLSFFIVIYYAVIKELRVLARICELYGFIIILGYLFTYYLVFTQGELINLRPFLGSGDIPTYLKATLAMIFPFVGMETITFIPIQKKNNKNIFKYTTLMIIFIGFLYIMVAESCISVIGVDDIIHYKDASIATIRRIDIPYLQFFRRLDGIFLSLWIMSIFCTLALIAYGTVFFISKCFNKINFNFLALIVMVAAFFLAQFPKTFDEVEQIISYTGYFSLLPIIVIPTILFIITKVKKYDKKTQ